MRRPLPCLLGLTLAAPATGAQALGTCCNVRSGCCVGYPASLRPQGESDAGEGQMFLSAGGQTELRA